MRRARGSSSGHADAQHRRAAMRRPTAIGPAVRMVTSALGLTLLFGLCQLRRHLLFDGSKACLLGIDRVQRALQLFRGKPAIVDRSRIADRPMYRRPVAAPSVNGPRPWIRIDAAVVDGGWIANWAANWWPVPAAAVNRPCRRIGINAAVVDGGWVAYGPMYGRPVPPHPPPHQGGAGGSA